MGATYTRQSTYSDGDVITAAHTNDEFNQLLAAFAASTGHTHDGTTAEGGPITKLLGTSLTFGDGTAGTDITVTFDGETNDGVLKWMEDEDYFEFSDDILVASTEKLQFRDTAIYLNSSTDGQLDIVADTEVQIAATTIDINGNADISGNLGIGGNLTVTGTTTFNGGTLTLGDANTDNIVFGGEVDSDIIPDDDDTHDLGSSGKQWKDIYIDGVAYVDAIDFNGTAITSTGAELNIMDGDTSATSTTLADADRVVVNDAGTMKQVALTDFETYFESALDTLSNVTTVGALDSGSITSGFGTIDTGSSTITTTGAITGGSLVVDNFTLNGTELDLSSGDFTLDVAGDIILNTDDGIVSLQDASATFGSLENSSGNLVIKSGTTTALTFSGANATIAGDLTISGDDLTMGTNTSGHIMVADGTNFNPVAVSGDVTIAANGAVTIASGAVETAMVNANVITGQTAETSLDTSNDVILIHDASASALRKTTLASISSALGGITDVVADTSPQLGGNLDTNSHNILIDDAHFIADENGNEQIIFQTTASAVNQIDVTNAATGNAPEISATGGDTNISLKLTPKGSGQVLLDGNVGVESGVIDLKNSGSRSKINFYCESGNAHAQSLQAAPHSESASNTLTLPSTGGDVDLVSTASTATLTNKTLTSPKINEDVALTATATELNLLDGVSGLAQADFTKLAAVDATAAELNLTDGSSAGTIVNSKAVIYGSSGEVNATTLQIAGTSITSTATELNLLDGVSGLVQADFTKLAAVDATSTELNIMDGDTSATSTTLVDADRLVANDAGTMKQVALTDVKTYLSSAGFSTEDPTALAIALG
jgi:hypothetical protein